MNLYVKSIWFTFLTMLASSLLAFLAMNAYYHQHLKGVNNDKNLAIAREVAAFVSTATPPRADAALRLLGEAGYQLYVTDGRRVERYGGRYRDESIDRAIISQVQGGRIYNGIREFPRETFVTGFFANELRNTVGVPLAVGGERRALFLRPNIQLLFGELHLLFGGLALGILALSIAGMLIVARLLIRPITALTKATEQMAAGAFDVPLSIRRKDEIGRLADRFLTMRAQVEQSIAKRAEFVHNVSHDIQSPLHAIQTQLALLQRDGDDPVARARRVAAIQEEAARMSNLTAQLLTLASFDAEAPEPMAAVRLDRQWQAVLSRLRYACDEKGIGVTARLEAADVLGNAALLEAVWENAFENAIKYSEPGGAIDVQVLAADPVVIAVRDEGIGMSAEEAERAFDRFYRADRARSSKGSGLGLAIVREIVHLHGGTVRIESAPGVGTTLCIALPLLRQ